MTSGDFAKAIRAAVLVTVAPWVIIVPLYLLIDRYRDRRAARQAEARRQVWEATHPREPPDELARLHQIRDRLLLESMPAHVRAHILRQRLEDAEREERARAILEAECQVQGNGEDHR